MMNALNTWLLKARLALGGKARTLREEGQGTTEYAILVGVLVVIAILAITQFQGKISSLWESIQDGINSL